MHRGTYKIACIGRSVQLLPVVGAIVLLVVVVLLKLLVFVMVLSPRPPLVHLLLMTLRAAES